MKLSRYIAITISISLITFSGILLFYKSNVRGSTVLIINGNPGVGKTTITKAISKLDKKFGFIRMNWDVLFAGIIPSIKALKNYPAYSSYSKYVQYKVVGKKLTVISGPEHDQLYLCLLRFIKDLVRHGNNLIIDQYIERFDDLNGVNPNDYLKGAKVYFIFIKSSNALEQQQARNPEGAIFDNSSNAGKYMEHDLIVENDDTPEEAAQQILDYIDNNLPKNLNK